MDPGDIVRLKMENGMDLFWEMLRRTWGRKSSKIKSYK